MCDAAVAAGVGRVGRVLEDRDDRGPGVGRAEVDVSAVRLHVSFWWKATDRLKLMEL